MAEDPSPLFLPLVAALVANAATSATVRGEIRICDIHCEVDEIVPAPAAPPLQP